VSFSSWRFAREPVELAGARVERGDAVMVLLAGANRDPGQYADADRAVPDRAGLTDHLSFGYGPHYCLGAGLARVSMLVALAAFLGRFPAARLAQPWADVVWEGVLGDRRPEKLGVVLR
jgi:cytochrome P450